MPTSRLEVAPQAIHFVYEAAVDLERPITVLDVGIGRGKYGLLLREYLGPALARITGLEAELRYVEEAPWVDELYDDVVFGDIADPRILGWAVAQSFDVVLMVDVLEHLTEADGTAVLRAFAPSTAIVVATPAVFFQNPEADDYPTETHRSIWDAPALERIRHLDRNSTEALVRYETVLVRLGASR